jgi:hypothetical protein
VIASLALVAALAPSPAPDPRPADPRPLDPAVPTSVPAPEGEDVPLDGTSMDEEAPPEPSVATVAPKAAPKATPPDPEERPREWASSKRRGALLLASIGAGGCGQDQCETLKAVPWFGLTGGYRFGRFAPIVTIQGGAGPAKAPSSVMTTDATIALDTARDTRTFLNIAAGTLLHLVMKSRFDPYFGLTIGYLRSSVDGPRRRARHARRRPRVRHHRGRAPRQPRHRDRPGPAPGPAVDDRPAGRRARAVRRQGMRAAG